MLMGKNKEKIKNCIQLLLGNHASKRVEYNILTVERKTTNLEFCTMHVKLKG